MTKQEFLELTQSKIVILDGSTGRNLQDRGMPTGVSPEKWMLENPQILIGLQREFLDAGSDVLFAPTFTANRVKLKEYGLEDQIQDVNKGLVRLSKEAISSYREKTGDERPVYIAADITMTGEQVQPLGNLSFEELVDIYKEQLGYILSEGVDLIVVETMMSLQECRAALLAAKEICDLPVIVSLTFNENGRTLYGTDPKTAVIVLQSMGADAIGINCSTGPDKMNTIFHEMKEYASVPIMVKPNAGIPRLVEGETIFPMDAEEFASELQKLVAAGANLVGGCCGATVKHMEHLVKAVKDMPSQPPRAGQIRALTTEQDTLEIPLEGSFVIIGERINPTGKKALQAELREGNLSTIFKMAEEQAEQGAQILDINVGMNGIDEKELLLQVMQEALQAAKLPLCIDTSKIDVMEAALRLYPGRALINSISLEKEKFEKLIPIAKKYGAMFILLPLSDKGLPKDLDEKKKIIHAILDRAFEIGLSKEDIIVDGLVTTVGANRNAAMEAIETIRYCKDELELATSIGLSNISYGLPERLVINATFLSFAMQAGLTMAIANPSQDLLMNTALASDLLLGMEGAAERYIERAVRAPLIVDMNKSKDTAIASKDIAKASADTTASVNAKQVDRISENTKTGANGWVSLDENKQAIYHSVVKGNKKSILTLVEKEVALGSAPNEIIEQLLIPAINEVGRLYDRQIYFLPQLISGAEVMKIAVDYLEPLMQKEGHDKPKATIVLATVAGDIHDIGKNLVALMLKNYGYRIIDLGKDVPSEKIIETAREEAADIIGLSALMTTTMVEMKRVVEMAKDVGLTAKIIIGGAVITESYAQEIGADAYCEDAQSAIALVQSLLDS